MTNHEVSVVPTQADREAAVSMYRHVQSQLKHPHRADVQERTIADTLAGRWDSDGSVQTLARHRLAHQTPPATIPADVARLVVAAREAGFEDPSPERMAELIAASEAFADRVPWDDEPEDAAELRAVAPPATQPSATVGEVERIVEQKAAAIDAACNLSLHVVKAHEAIRALMTALHNPYHPAYEQGREVLSAGKSQDGEQAA